MKRLAHWLALGLAAFFLFVFAGVFNAEDYPKLAPYSAIRWTAEQSPEVLIEGKWVAFRSIDGISVDLIIDFAKERHQSRWRKRFEEDLVQVLSEMGKAPGQTVELTVADVETGRERRLDDVPMTEGNRRAIWKAALGIDQTPSMPADLDPGVLRRALADFERALDERWSYRHASDANFESAIAALRRRIDEGLPPEVFGIELQKIIALGIDGHAGVSALRPGGKFTPFLVEPVGDRFVAFSPDRASFLAKGLPYLVSIDGKTIEEWCEAAAALVPKGSPQYQRHHCLRQLRRIDDLRGIMGRAKLGSVKVELVAEDGKTSRTLDMATISRFPVYGTWPRDDSRLLEGGIGYLRLPQMDADAEREIEMWMPQFRETEGLIVDVRDNGGGSRHPLRLLYSYLAAPDDPPRVITAAAYRLHPAHAEDHLAARYMYRADSREWTADQRHAVAGFAATFEPESTLPEGQFSDWHYMVLDRLDLPDRYYYKKKVVVLMNAKCFSATDIFLAGLKGMKRVTLLGTPSGGGSARSQGVELGETPFRLRIGSMASFMADGRLFDGHGVSPDIEVSPNPESFIGGRDHVLDEAIRHLEAR